MAQWLTENLVLSLSAARAVSRSPYGAVRLVVAFGPADVPRLDETAVDARCSAFTWRRDAGRRASGARAGGSARGDRCLAAALKDGFGRLHRAGRGRGGARLIVGEVRSR